MPVSFGMRLKEAKALFFDRPAVMRMMTKKERSVLSRFGAFVRRRAKSSIKISRTNETSEPGEVPKGHTGQLRSQIYFAADPGKRSVVIGPTLFGTKTGEELSALEQGGMSTMTESAGGAARRRRRVYVRARPFMLPAFKSELPQVASMMATVA